MSPITAPKQTALLLIDVINDLEFEGGADLLEHARPMAQQLARLKVHVRREGIPIIYANDNFGQWHADFRKLVTDFSAEQVRGHEIVQLLEPNEEDYFILKPKHSAFYQTSLEVLLNNLAINTLILTGMASDICVLFTGNDAYMRGMEIIVPADCVAAEDVQANQAVLQLMQRVLKADITPFTAWR